MPCDGSQKSWREIGLKPAAIRFLPEGSGSERTSPGRNQTNIRNHSMNKKTTYALTALIVSVGASLQADYNSEIQLGYTNHDFDGNDVDLYQAGVTLYTRPLTYRGKTPHDEAAFFNKVGQVDIVYGRVDDSDLNFDAYGVTYTARSADSPHGFSASWMHSDPGYSLNAYGAGYFRYLDTGFTVGADIEVLDDRNNDQWAYRVSSKRLFAFQGDRWLSLDGGLTWTDYASDNKFGAEVAANYYFTPRTSLGVTLGTDEDFDDLSSEFRLTHYIGEAFALDLGFGRDFIDRSSDPKQYRLGGRFRF